MRSDIIRLAVNNPRMGIGRVIPIPLSPVPQALPWERVRHICLLVHRIGDIQRWSFIANLEKLPPNHLIPLQVKCTNGRFLNAFHSVGLLTDTVGYIVVSTRIVIHPVVVDGYKSTEDALIFCLSLTIRYGQKAPAISSGLQTTI